VGHPRPDRSEELPRLVRRGVAHRVGQVDRRRAGLDDGFDDAAQELEIAARGVLGRELDVRGVLAREADGFDRRLEALVARHAQLGLEVEVRGRDERVDAALGRRLDGPGRALEVGAVAARQARDHGTADLGGDGAHRLRIGRATQSGSRPR
jgi:hypothetical protein